MRQRLAQLGYVEPRDIELVLKWAHGRGDLLQPLAEQLALLAPDLVVTATTAAAMAVKRAMPTVPIVSATLIDPIGAGLVESYARPGGTVTGTLISLETLPGKQLEPARWSPAPVGLRCSSIRIIRSTCSSESTRQPWRP